MSIRPRPSASPHLPVLYRFFDVRLALQSTRLDVIEGFDAVYGAFRQSSGHGGARTVDCWIDTDELGRGRIIVNGKRRRISMPDPDNAYAFTLIFDAVAAASQTHLFLHASAVCIDEQAALFVGPSGSGKSTLAETLVRRGAVGLTDDVAPIDLSTGLVRSFFSATDALTSRELACTPQHVFLLRPTLEPVGFHFAIDRFPRAWRRSPPWGSEEPVVVRRREGYWEVAGETCGAEAMDAFRQACQRDGVTVLQRLGGKRARFGETPVLGRMSPAIGLPWVAAEVLGRAHREVGGLLLDVTRTIGTAALWKLVPGPPDDTAQAVLDVVRSAASVPSARSSGRR